MDTEQRKERAVTTVLCVWESYEQSALDLHQFVILPDVVRIDAFQVLDVECGRRVQAVVAFVPILVGSRVVAGAAAWNWKSLEVNV
jgi:hypothetical protein